MNWDFISNNLALKVLSLVLAFLLWFLVASQKPVEQEFAIPLLFKNIQAGLTIAQPHPDKIHVSLAGSMTNLKKFAKQKVVIILDMENFREGQVAFTDFTGYLTIPDGLSLTRISPSVVELKLIRNRHGSLDSYDSSGGVK
jgi:hypothetical protein